jgi:hypothetical protein
MTWPMTLPGVDRVQHAIRRIVWRAMPTIPGMMASPVTIAEIVTDALRELDGMQAEYAERRAEYVRVQAEAQRLEQLLSTAVADLDHSRANSRIMTETIDRLRGSVTMLDREVQRYTMDREQLAALGER